MTALVKYDTARTALAEAHPVDEAKDIRDKAVALQAYARQAQDRDLIAWSTEIKIRAERRTGELLRETATNGQRKTRGRPNKTSTANDILSETLDDLGISRDQSSDWQQLAAIPPPEFEQRMEQAKRDPATMTTAKLLRPVVAPKPNPFEEELRVWAGVSAWLARAKELPSLEELKAVRPEGGLKAALRANVLEADHYITGLRRLHREGWL